MENLKVKNKLRQPREKIPNLPSLESIPENHLSFLKILLISVSKKI